MRNAGALQHGHQRLTLVDGVNARLPSRSHGNARPRVEDTRRGAFGNRTSQGDRCCSDRRTNRGDEESAWRPVQSICLRMNVGISMSSRSLLDDGEVDGGGIRVGRGAAPSHAGRPAGPEGLETWRSRVGNGRTEGAEFPLFWAAAGAWGWNVLWPLLSPLAYAELPEFRPADDDG